MGLICSFSSPVCVSPRFLYFHDIFSSPPAFLLASKLSTPGLLQNCSQKIINDFHVATSDNQFSVIVLRIDLWAAFILVNHTLLFHILSSMGNTATWFFPYLDDLYIGSSSFPYFWMWITQGLHLWLLSYLHSQPTWPHPLPKVLHIILIPPSENVYLQSKTFSWTLDLNIQLPTWFLHFDVYEASQT